MIDASTLPTFMIVVKGNRVSEGYADFVTPRWWALGFDVERFDAITPDTLPDYLNFQPIVNQKYKRRGIKKEHTPTEKAVWYSHTELWKKCIAMDTPIVVLEHDVIPKGDKQFEFNEAKEVYRVYDRGAMGCYVITPIFAKWMMSFLTDFHGMVDSGPGSLIDWVTYDPHFFPMQHAACDGKNVVVHKSERYRPMATQVVDDRYGTVIDHYGGTEAEAMIETFKDFPYERIKLPF
jgi:hypothetical protein